MRLYKSTKRIAALSASLMLSLALVPMQVEAQTVLPTGGVASLLEHKMTTSQYIIAAEEAKGAAWGYTNLGIANVENNHLNVREQPDASAVLVGQMPKDSVCEVLETADGWAHIKSGEVEGYVSLEYLLTGPDAVLKASELVRTVVTVGVDNLNIREKASSESRALTQASEGDELEYLENVDDWIKVAIDGREAYVSADYVTVEEKLATAITMMEVKYGVGISDVRADLAEYAQQFLGNPYVWGGVSLTKGADCSGFVLSIYKKYGIELPHYSGYQANCGTQITEEELLPGDLIFYANSSGTINHVGIYIGNDQVIHASSPSSGIKISTYNYRTPVKCVRLLED